MDTDLIARSLELVAERHGDPAPLVYARLFADHPDMEALFVRDTAGSVRGQMLMVVIESLLDYIGGDAYSANLIRIERINHEGLGVPPEVFDTFFATVMATFKDLLGEDWTPETDAAWHELLAELGRITA
ncbi:MAG: globin [Alphaproteobacteria bacterium]|nr:globin [Alphaproteobacteria bacterium]